MFLSFILLLLCIIAQHQHSNRRLCEKHNLTDSVKMIAAIAVVVCHLFTFYMHHPAWAAESQFGSLSVSIFFFLSGYGLMCSYSLKGKKYLEGFCIHRISKIIIPLLTAYIIYIPILRLINHTGGIIEAIQRLFSSNPLLPYSWYVTEITLLYLLFYLVMRFIPRYKLPALSLAIVFMLAGMLLAGLPHWWINASPCFIIGLWYYKYEHPIMNQMNKVKKQHFITLILLFLCTYCLDIVQDHIQILSRWRYTYASFYLVNILFILLVLYILQKVNFGKNIKVTQNCYYEIYLMQGTVFLLLDTMIHNRLLFFILAIVSTIISSLGMHWINKRIMRVLKI
ncbi:MULTISPECIES: acyltransferase family protein [Bacteroides]|uniref:Acyltransferase 3 domain-containing protein n=3 Tax=Bacteroides TaxID=816 RepID=A0A0I9ULY0_BACFG|nr:acyltransferase [Bacteroides hominis (ex Liu et al. 2022)]MCE8568610.1 acyltransferase [Bacteroides fragilis]MCM0196922.1 acyltransferase [Bacteroides fragilis]MCM0198493.1 acyltransferase [Bacteroides fragilis]MCM0208844.1 acyltransferase [Bacteroides fragilis]MCM0212691.1 acyltransferase [Bacteroides fragilis]